jgi:heme-degrading monooxygenase HmoA
LRTSRKVQDYSAWRRIFDDGDKTRREYGFAGFQAFRSASDPNDTTARIDWPSVDATQAFVASDSPKEKMKNAGVISQPEVMFLEEA